MSVFSAPVTKMATRIAFIAAVVGGTPGYLVATAQNHKSEAPRTLPVTEGEALLADMVREFTPDEQITSSIKPMSGGAGPRFKR